MLKVGWGDCLPDQRFGNVFPCLEAAATGGSTSHGSMTHLTRKPRVKKGWLALAERAGSGGYFASPTGRAHHLTGEIPK